MADEFVWMFHEETGNSAAFPVAAVPLWTPRGWEPCDPPVEPDVTKVHLAHAPAVEADAEDETDETDEKPVKTTKRAAAAAAKRAAEEDV
jgi:hypothetical protein